MRAAIMPETGQDEKMPCVSIQTAPTLPRPI